VICDNALVSGFASQMRPIGPEIIREVCADFDLKLGGLSRHAQTGPPVPVPAAAAEHKSTKAPLFSSFGRKRGFSFF
jgi:hypothetical protein